MRDTTQFTIAGLSIVICIALSVRYYLQRCRRKENPQDYAYYLHERFGPTLRLPPLERVKRGLPHIPDATLQEWISGFSAVGASIDSLAQQGGTEALTWQVVKSKLQSDFPFLQNEGLRHAIFLVDYMAWHDGYLPEKKPNQ